MDFFESQELARRNTRWLIILFVLAVLAIIVAIFALTVVVMASQSDGENLTAIVTDWRLILAVAAGVLAVVGTGSAMKMIELRNGGATVAELMGGRRIVGNSRRITERRVANVVEEMALASGVPVPPVYILDQEESINAFAAGFTIDDAVIGLNRGTIEKLSREELQGVVAHEFSHILNGDMRMSLRMVAVLHGILLISIIGGQLIKLASRIRSEPHRSRNNKNQNGGKMVLLLIGAGLYLIGTIGLFFGRLIKSTVSRQREYLADASAVQFTRIPSGIAGALKMIGGSTLGSRIQSANSEQISHMFFGSAHRSLIFATHPPLLKRIREIDEDFDGDYQNFIVERNRRKQYRDQQATERKEQQKNKTKQFFDFLPGSDQFELSGKMKLPVNPLILIAGIGTPTNQDVEYSGLMVNEIPDDLLHAVRETFSARCVVFASLLNQQEDVFKKTTRSDRKNRSPWNRRSHIEIEKTIRRIARSFAVGCFRDHSRDSVRHVSFPIFCLSPNGKKIDRC